tara:strand:+ start:497 stop:847 length:351 start_codon:yes stop_codon:yes gene_type:complete
MLQITPQHKVFVATSPIDFRKGIDAIVGLCNNVLNMDPFSGYVFVFRNRKATSIRILVYDTQGFWLCTKRLSSGKFMHWPTNVDKLYNMSACEILTLLYNGDPKNANFQTPWKSIT